MTDDWRAEIEREREQKEAYFREHPRSPIPQDHDFAGLEHYPIDPDLRFVLPMHEHDEKEEIAVETTAEGEQTYVRWGEFRFSVGDEGVTLQAYRPASGEDRFWVPFRDATSGSETYGAGRYIDLDPEEHRTTDGEWVLDFNTAYNPTCAYNYIYECPLTPGENWLEVAIEAGEKDYPGEPVQPSH